MGSLVGTYNLALVQITLGAFRVTGFDEDDACTIAPKGDLQESAPSADGHHVAYSVINDNRYEVKITVRRTSLAFRRLGELQQAQMDERREGTVTALGFQAYDPVSGDKISEQSCQFMRAPDLPFNRTSSVAEFMLELPSPTIIYGANLT